MKLSTDDVKKVAKLANLVISDADLQRYSSQLSKILDYIDQLNQVNTEGVEPTYNVTGLSDVMRPDEVKLSLSQEEALKNSSNKKDGLFMTKGVFADE